MRPQGSPLPWRLEAREGADLAAVRLRVEGADAVAVDGDALRLTTALGDLAVPLLHAGTVERATCQRGTPDAAGLRRDSAVCPAPPIRKPATRRAAAIPRPTRCSTPPSSAAAADDGGYGIAVDGAGQAYVTGYTTSADFPASLGPGYDTSFNGGDDAFVVKLDAAGTGLRLRHLPRRQRR